MLEALIWGLSPTIYLVGVAISTRVIHIRRSREWMRWKNENPNESYEYFTYSEYGNGRRAKLRKDFVLQDYIKYVSLDYGRWIAWLWPARGPYALIKRFCFPEVKIPDVARIEELEGKDIALQKRRWAQEREDLLEEIEELKTNLEIERELNEP